MGSHQIGGFLETFLTDNYFCRYCHIQHFEKCNINLKTNFHTKESYQSDVEMSLITNTYHRRIKNNSPLNKLNFFHVTTGLLLCLAHDILEGIAPYDIMMCINGLINEKILLFEYLNNGFKWF